MNSIGAHQPSESQMNAQRVFGIILFVAGIALLLVGMHASDSATDRVRDPFTGQFTSQTIWYMLGGGTSVLLGLLLILVSARGNDAA